MNTAEKPDIVVKNKVTSLISDLVCIGLGISGLFSENATAMHDNIVNISSVFILILGLFNTALFFLEKIELTGQTIKSHNGFTRAKVFDIHSIKKVERCNFGIIKIVFIYTNEGHRIRISSWMAGFKDFMKKLQDENIDISFTI